MAGHTSFYKDSFCQRWFKRVDVFPALLVLMHLPWSSDLCGNKEIMLFKGQIIKIYPLHFQSR